MSIFQVAFCFGISVGFLFVAGMQWAITAKSKIIMVLISLFTVAASFDIIKTFSILMAACGAK